MKDVTVFVPDFPDEYLEIMSEEEVDDFLDEIKWCVEEYTKQSNVLVVFNKSAKTRVDIDSSIRLDQAAWFAVHSAIYTSLRDTYKQLARRRSDAEDRACGIES